MVLHLKENDISLMKWKDKNGIEWNYISPNELQKKKSGKIFLFGDIGKKGKFQEDILVNKNLDKLQVYDTRIKIGFFENITGYIECIEERENKIGFVRIITIAKLKILLLLLFLILTCMIIGWISNSKFTPELDKAAISYQMPDNARNTDSDMISMPGITQIIYKKSSNKVITPLINPEGNDCYFRYKIMLRETGEVIYQSKNLEPGMALIDFDISKALEIGEFEISIIAEAKSLKNPDKFYNTGQINATLKVIE